MENGFVRKMSGLEAFFVDLDACGCNMTIHFCLELNRKPNVDRLRMAMKQIMKTHEGINVRFYRNAWYVSSYVHDCPVIDVEGEDLSNYKPSRLDFRQSSVDLKILHATLSDKWYICFDFFHGAVDGRSGMQFVYDFFDVLNNRQFPEPDFGFSAKSLVHDGEKSDKKHRPAFTVFPKCRPSRWRTRRGGEDKTAIISHNGKIRSTAAHYSDIIGRLFGNKSAKMIIPVDVRRHADNCGKAMYGNLFVPMFLEAKSCASWKEMHGEIIGFAKHKPYLMSVEKKLDIYSKIPTYLRQTVIRGALPLVMGSKKFIYCALVSALGAIDSDRLICKDFAVKDYNVTFVSFPFTAFSVISLQYMGRTNTTVCWNSGRVPDRAARILMRRINECMNRHTALG